MVILLKKLISFCLGFCCLSIFNQADALEFDKKAIMKEFKCDSVTTLNYAMKDVANALTKEDRGFEDERVKVEALIHLTLDNLLVSSSERQYLANSTIILPTGGNSFLGFNTFVLIAPCIMFKITNKTEQPIEFDLDHSQITIGTYQGRGVQQGTKYNGAATSVQAPVMIFPKSTKEVALWRTDHNFYNGFSYQGQTFIPSKWLPTFDVVADKNLMGDMILCFDKKYITMSPKAVIESSKLKWIKKGKKS